MTERRWEIYNRIVTNTVQVDGPLESPCWVWQGGTSGENPSGGGYGRISINGQTCAVHRVMFTHAHGFIPRRRVVDHLCNNRLCCNPTHLELVTQIENCKRRDKRRIKIDA